MNVEASFRSDEVRELPSSYKIALEVAYQRALTRTKLHKYDNAQRHFVYGQTVGYGVIAKQGGFNDVVEVKKLEDYRKERMEAVQEIMMQAARI